MKLSYYQTPDTIYFTDAQAGKVIGAMSFPTKHLDAFTLKFETAGYELYRASTIPFRKLQEILPGIPLFRIDGKYQAYGTNATYLADNLSLKKKYGVCVIPNVNDVWRLGRSVHLIEGTDFHGIDVLLPTLEERRAEAIYYAKQVTPFVMLPAKWSKATWGGNRTHTDCDFATDGKCLFALDKLKPADAKRLNERSKNSSCVTSPANCQAVMVDATRAAKPAGVAGALADDLLVHSDGDLYRVDPERFSFVWRKSGADSFRHNGQVLSFYRGETPVAVLMSGMMADDVDCETVLKGIA